MMPYNIPVRIDPNEPPEPGWRDGVRECPLCPPWVECAHLGEWCVRLVTKELWLRHPVWCRNDHGRFPLGGEVRGPSRLTERGEFNPNICWSQWPLYTVDGPLSWRQFTDERAARDEFEARCEAMRAMADAEP